MANDPTKTTKAGKGSTGGNSAGKPVKAESAKPVKTAKAVKAAPSTPNAFERFGKYLRDVRVEMRRVVWPSREEVIQSSIVVVIALAFFIVYVGIWDLMSEWALITLPIQLFGGK